MGLKPKGLEQYLKEPAVVEDHPFMTHYPNRCVLCGRCVRVCRTKEGRPQLSFAKRGFETGISFYGMDRETMPGCEDCLECVKVCPVGALALKTPAPVV
jgi:NADH dehydrogenase/NADH:ubiquinone oxidoreductase subunit G